MDVSPQFQHYLKLLVGFGSYIILPFLGLLSYFKNRVFPYMAGFCFAWLLLGAVIIGGGITSMGPGDIVTREDREYWFGLPWVQQVQHIWFIGLLILIPLMIATWVFEHKTLSRPVKLLIKILKLALFPFGVWKFIQMLQH